MIRSPTKETEVQAVKIVEGIGSRCDGRASPSVSNQYYPFLGGGCVEPVLDVTVG